MLRRRKNWWFWNENLDINWLYQFRIHTFFMKILFRSRHEYEKNANCCEILYDHVNHIVLFLYRMNVVASLIFYSSNDNHRDKFENCWKKEIWTNISFKYFFATNSQSYDFIRNLFQSIIHFIDWWLKNYRAFTTIWNF